MKTEYRPLSIYIHIPFCVQKCLYCDFLSAPAGEEVKKRYTESLVKEIRRESVNFSHYEVATVFIGGGTPSILRSEWMRMILEAVYESYRVRKDAEITIEVNPGTVTPGKLQAYHDMGISRLSIGLQSAIDEELRLLGRIHTAEDFFTTYEYAVKTGFNNINIDLMSSIPAQSVESCVWTLERVLGLDPQPSHISSYSLIIEEGTPFYENTPVLPDEETDRRLYKITGDILKRKGYHRYEISNYARDGYECRHNKVYWKRGEYRGFGIGAASLIDNSRFNNIRSLGDYIKRIEEGTDVRENMEKLSLHEQMEEFMFLGLRLTEGVSYAEFQENFGKTIDDVYPGVVKKFEKQGLLICGYDEKGKKLRLSELGLDVSNMVMAEFLLT